MAPDGEPGSAPTSLAQNLLQRLALGEPIDEFVEQADLLHQRVFHRFDPHAADPARDERTVWMHLRCLGEEVLEARLALDLPLQAGLVVAGEPADDAVRFFLRATFALGLSPATAAEAVRVLAYPKFRLSAAEREELLVDYLPYCRSVRIPARLPSLPQCRRADDQMFIVLAAIGKADFLVTGDKALLALAPAFGRHIVTVEAFLHDGLGVS